MSSEAAKAVVYLIVPTIWSRTSPTRRAILRIRSAGITSSAAIPVHDTNDIPHQLFAVSMRFTPHSEDAAASSRRYRSCSEAGGRAGGRKGHLGSAWSPGWRSTKANCSFRHQKRGCICVCLHRLECQSRVKEKLTVRTSRAHDTSPPSQSTTALESRIRRVL